MKEKYFVQSNLKIDPKKVAGGEINSYQWEYEDKGHLSDGIVRMEAKIVRSLFMPDENTQYWCYHLDNDYWSTILKRSGFRDRDWISVDKQQ